MSARIVPPARPLPRGPARCWVRATVVAGVLGTPLLAPVAGLWPAWLSPVNDGLWAADDPAPAAPPAPPAPATPSSPPPHLAPGAPAAPATPSAQAGLVIGEFDLAPSGVTDGDTLRLPGLGPVRVLGLDCEEVFRNAGDRQAAAADFAAYAASKRGEAPMPVKFATPAGEAARAFVLALVGQGTRVRLELDEVGGHELDGFERRLAHVALLGPTGERWLALDVVRAGHSPYFTKYGRSLRLDAEFVRAEAEARAAQRGIWSASGPGHYGDYDERRRWWDARARQVDAWRALPPDAGRIALGTRDAAERLAARVGHEATVFGTLRKVRTESWPHILWLSDRRGADVPAVVFEQTAWSALDMQALATRFVTVTGPVTLYRGKPQIEVRAAGQVSTR